MFSPHNEAIITQIIKKNSKDGEYKISNSFDLTRTIYNQIEKNEKLYIKILPYLEFKSSGTLLNKINLFYSDLSKDSLKTLIISNKNLFYKLDFFTQTIHKVATEKLDIQSMKELNKNIFKGILFDDKQNPTEVKLDILSYLLPKSGLYNKMDSIFLRANGPTQATHFINALTRDDMVLKALKIDKIINYDIADEINFQLIFVNPKEKDLVANFISNIPELFEIMLEKIDRTESSVNNFLKQQDIIETFVPQMCIKERFKFLNDILVEKTKVKNKSKL